MIKCLNESNEKESYTGKSDNDFYYDMETQYKYYKVGIYNKLKITLTNDGKGTKSDV